MDHDRYHKLMFLNDGELTQDEINSGWHFCYDWDGLLVGPGTDEAFGCHCNEEIQKWKLSDEAVKRVRQMDMMDEELNNENPFKGIDS